MPSDVSPAGRSLVHLTTMWDDTDDHWNAHTALVDWRLDSRLHAFVRETLRRAKHHDALIVVGSVGWPQRYRDLVAAILVTRLHRRPPVVVVTDATWECDSASLRRFCPPLARLTPLLARAFARLIDDHNVHYCVLSKDEVGMFPSIWRVDPHRVHFTPFCHSLWDGTLDRQTGDEGYLFAGGNSLRDYDLLAEALTLTRTPVTTRVASRWRPQRPLENVQVEQVPHETFQDWLLGCRAVVVPLQPSVRSAGQQTYLNAMALGKPVIVTDAPGVRDYVTDGQDGIVVPREPQALADAIEMVMDPCWLAGPGAKMVERARRTATEVYSRDNYRRRICDLADALVTARERRSVTSPLGAASRDA